jgi:hypothetical protein
MTDAELDRLEALFRNPPSASGLAEHGLRLIEALRLARAPAIVSFPAGEVVLPGPISAVGNVILEGAKPAPPVSSAPTPPQRPKKGK